MDLFSQGLAIYYWVGKDIINNPMNYEFWIPDFASITGFNTEFKGVTYVSNAKGSNNFINIWTFALTKIGGIIVSEDGLKTFNYYYHNYIFGKHELFRDDSFGAAFVKNKDLLMFKLCITKDVFKTINIVDHPSINDLKLTDFKITDEGFIVVSGTKNDISEIWINKDEGKTFELTVKMEGKISGLDYDGKNKLLYFGSILDSGTEIYKFYL